MARYNAGPSNPAAEKTYVCAVIRNMIASGFGRGRRGARALQLVRIAQRGGRGTRAYPWSEMIFGALGVRRLTPETPASPAVSLT